MVSRDFCNFDKWLLYVQRLWSLIPFIETKTSVAYGKEHNRDKRSKDVLVPATSVETKNPVAPGEKHVREKQPQDVLIPRPDVTSRKKRDTAIEKELCTVSTMRHSSPMSGPGKDYNLQFFWNCIIGSSSSFLVSFTNIYVVICGFEIVAQLWLWLVIYCFYATFEPTLLYLVTLVLQNISMQMLKKERLRISLLVSI